MVILWVRCRWCGEESRRAGLVVEYGIGQRGKGVGDGLGAEGVEVFVREK